MRPWPRHSEAARSSMHLRSLSAFPNLTRRLFGEGAFSAAFLPAFVTELRSAGSAAAWRFVTATLAALGGLLLLLTAAAELVLLGFWRATDDVETQLLIGLTATFFPYQIAICLTAQLAAVMHAFDQFALPAALPLVMNGCWLAVLLAADSTIHHDVARAYLVAGGVLISGAIQLLVAFLAVRRLGFRWQWQWRDVRSKVGRLLLSLLPVLFALSISELNGMIDSWLAWVLTAGQHVAPGGWHPLPAGTTSALYLGQRLYQFPVGIVGVALGTVLFPRLSRHAAAGELPEMRHDLKWGLELALSIGIPASIGLICVSDLIARLLFHHGAFDRHDAAATATAIAGYATGVWAYVALSVASRACYAAGNRTAPLRAGLIALLVNLSLDLLLVWQWGVWGLAIASSLSAAGQLGSMLSALRKQNFLPETWFLLQVSGRSLLAGLPTVAFSFAVLQGLPGESMAEMSIALGVIVAGSIGSFLWLARVLRLQALCSLLSR